jgi:hypothetical protein
MWSEAERSMRSLACPIAAAFSLFVFGAAAFAQETPQSVNLPNPMALHTWFIIAAFGAFLLWCISYTIQIQKETLARKKGRDDLLHRKEDLLDQMAELENRREANEIPDPKYRRQMKDLRHSLSKVIEELGQTESQKSVKRGT